MDSSVNGIIEDSGFHVNMHIHRHIKKRESEICFLTHKPPKKWFVSQRPQCGDNLPNPSNELNFLTSMF